MLSDRSISSSLAVPASAPTEVRILETARRHLFAYGYCALTMDALAHELGMSKKTLYLHFPGKDAIVSTIIDDIGHTIRQELDSVLNHSKLPFSQKLRAIVDIIIPRLALMSPAMLREFQRHAPKIHQMLDDLRQKNIPTVFGRLFRSGIIEGSLHPDLDPDFAAQFWLQAIRGLVHPDTLAITHLSPKQTLEKALDLFTRGLLHRQVAKNMINNFPFRFAVISAFAFLLASCNRPAPTGWQGYLEGDFVYVAAPLSGQLEKLYVQKGARVEAGAQLFSLEQSAELSILREAAQRLRQSQAKLADLKKGQRPTELAALEARLSQATTNAELSGRELRRATKLHETAVVSDDDYDRVRLNHEANTKLIGETTAQLETAQLGGRVDAIAAGEADVAAAQATVDHAGWGVAQKSQMAQRPSLVYDTLFREGEFVSAGKPIVALLPPENIKVRFFVPETEFAALKAGAAVKVTISGQPVIEGHISYLSPQPEYTPPVLYNRENRSKLVFMIEATFDPAIARDLHPGQPVDVSLAK